MSDTPSDQFDVLVIGAGIAGASVAFELAADARVAVLEMESQPGYHTTGRSAAVFSELYGPAPIRALTGYSRGFFENPPDVFGREPLLTPRGVLYIARSDQRDSLSTFAGAMVGKPGVRSLDAHSVEQTLPLLRSGHAIGGVFETGARDIDVNGLHQGFLRGFRQRSGRVITSAQVTGLARKAGSWSVSTRNGEFSAPVVVNAAGAWADAIAVMAGVRKIDRAGQTGTEVSTGTEYALPDFRLTGNVTYQNGPFSVFLQGRYIGSGTLENAAVEGVNISSNHVDSVFYTDLNFGWTKELSSGQTLQLFANVQNLTNEAPPISPWYSVFVATAEQHIAWLHDVLGRRFTAGRRLLF